MAKLYVCGIKDIGNFDFVIHKFFIAQYIKDRDSISRYGFARCPDLAPEKHLVNQYLGFRNKGEWTQEKFDTWYRPLFIQQMYTRIETKGVLNHVHKLITSGDDVVLACYCHDENMCHRRIIAEEFEKKGIEVVYG